MASDLVLQLIAANKGNKQAAGDDIFYKAAERIDSLEEKNAKLNDAITWAITHYGLVKTDGIIEELKRNLET